MVLVGDGTVMSTINPGAIADPHGPSVADLRSRLLEPESVALGELRERTARARREQEVEVRDEPVLVVELGREGLPAIADDALDRRQRPRDLGFVVLEPVTGAPHGLAVHEDRLPPVGHDEREGSVVVGEEVEAFGHVGQVQAGLPVRRLARGHPLAAAIVISTERAPRPRSRARGRR